MRRSRRLAAAILAGLVLAAAFPPFDVGPLALVTMIAAVGMHGFQGGWSFAPGALSRNWSRLNPASGAKRLSPAITGVEALKALLVLAVVVTLAWQAVIARR